VKPFRATYTPQRLNTREGDTKEGEDFILGTVPNTDKTRPVLIVALQKDQAIFVGSNGALGMDIIGCFTDCQIEWRG